MFKSLTILKYTGDIHSGDNAKALERNSFTPCEPSQQLSIGFVPPRGFTHGALMESTHQVHMLKVCIEEKTVPTDVIKRKVSERCDQFEKETGLRPGRKYQRELSNEVMLDLLPQAFPKQKTVEVLFSPELQFVFINSTSKKQVDLISTLLMKTFGGLVLDNLATNTSLSFTMADWLLNGEPPRFTIDMDCKLKSSDDKKTSVAYTHTNLLNDEVTNYLGNGFQPVQLALTWRDRVSFMLTDSFSIKRVEFLDIVFASKEGQDDAFDADLAIYSSEMLPLVVDLIQALGGPK